MVQNLLTGDVLLLDPDTGLLTVNYLQPIIAEFVGQDIYWELREVFKTLTFEEINVLRDRQRELRKRMIDRF